MKSSGNDSRRIHEHAKMNLTRRQSLYQFVSQRHIARAPRDLDATTFAHRNSPALSYSEIVCVSLAGKVPKAD
jgi:hypothetical protein